MLMFTIQNFTIVKEQMSALEDEKIISIAKTVEPVISINMTLGIDNAYEEDVNRLLESHPFIQKISIFDIDNKVIYSKEQSSHMKHSMQDSNRYTTTLTDKISNTYLGSVTFYYTLSSNFDLIIKEYKNFLVFMFVIFIFSIIVLILSIYFTLKPLKDLRNKLALYNPNEPMLLKSIDAKNEIAVINNTAREMLIKIKTYTNELMDINNTLEEKVNMRTKELHNTNLNLRESQENLKKFNNELELRVEEEVKKRSSYEKNLARQSRLAAMGEMIDNIAHQWRQPLMNINVILMNIDRAYELGKLDEEYIEEKIDEATSLTAHMSQTIEDFRSFFRPEKEKHLFDSNSLFHDTLLLLSSSLSEIDLELSSQKNIEIFGYKSELVQVMISILTNAIEIFALRKIENKKINIELKEDVDNVIISIRDNAGGMDEDVLERVFEPYYTTKHKAGGTGLGLYICQMIVEESMHGTISVENIKDGVKFMITIAKEEQ